MKITILTLFPEMFRGPFTSSIVKIAQDKELLKLEIKNIRDFGIGPHKTVDDTPYGGGIGMVLRVDVVKNAIDAVKNKNLDKSFEKVFLMAASGTPFVQKTAREFSTLEHLILVCGHYEGIDARIENYIDGELSIGDFVTTGGELPAMLITDAVARLISGVLKENATSEESFSIIENEQQLLEYPHFTRPEDFEGQKVPEVLLSGNHKHINEWRIQEAIKKTQKIRPDLLKK